MATYTYPIVGAYFRPPAQALLDYAAVGVKMILRAEPDNAYDEHAIAVLLPRESVPDENVAFESALNGYGSSREEVLLADSTHVGYIPKEFAAELKSKGFPNGQDVEGQFSVNTNGKPRVRFDAE